MLVLLVVACLVVWSMRGIVCACVCRMETFKGPTWEAWWKRRGGLEWEAKEAARLGRERKKKSKEKEEEREEEELQWIWRKRKEGGKGGAVRREYGVKPHRQVAAAVAKVASGAKRSRFAVVEEEAEEVRARFGARMVVGSVRVCACLLTLCCRRRDPGRRRRPRRRRRKEVPGGRCEEARGVEEERTSVVDVL